MSALVLAGALNGASFREWGRDARVADHFSADIPRFFEFLASQAGENDVYISRWLDDLSAIRFLNLARGCELHRIDSPAFFVAPRRAGRDRVIASATLEVSLLVETFYPEAEVIGRFATDGGSTGRVYLIPRERLRPSLAGHERAVADYLLRRSSERLDQWGR